LSYLFIKKLYLI